LGLSLKHLETISAREIKNVVGLGLREGASFGLNVTRIVAWLKKERKKKKRGEGGNGLFWVLDGWCSLQGGR
jgi:hypothetical protein